MAQIIWSTVVIYLICFAIMFGLAYYGIYFWSIGGFDYLIGDNVPTLLLGLGIVVGLILGPVGFVYVLISINHQRFY